MRQLFGKKNIVIICALALFNFVFLCEEFLFDGMIGDFTTQQGVVNAQNVILGASVLGFMAFPLFRKACRKMDKYIMTFLVAIIAVLCMILVYGHQNFAITMVAGIVEYIILGLAGATACYFATMYVENRKHLAKVVGISYALGVFVQFVNNNLVKQALNQTIVLVVAFSVLGVLLHVLEKAPMDVANTQMETPRVKNPTIAVIALVASIAFMTCIFSTLDNAVTLVHASGSFNIGQWPRLILAVSGLVAGILYDIAERRYMSIMMYLVTLLATICVVVIETGGSFVIGLIMFYISAGFFVVFFMTSFMDLSLEMKEPSIWAGMGRAINNLCAILTTWISVALLAADNGMAILIVALLLFAAINAALVVYFLQLHRPIKKEIHEEEVKTGFNNTEATLAVFSEHFHLTRREEEVLEAMLIHSEDSVQAIAEHLAISRAALYRHIGSINEKTGTKNRVSLLKFFYSWKEED